MDHQLKQTALPCRLSGEHFGGRYSPLTRSSALADVASRVGISVGLVAAAGAFEGGLVGSVLLIDASTSAALSRRVAGINEDYGDTGTLRFVGNESAQLTEPPISQSCSLVSASGRYPTAYALQILQGQSASGAFSVADKSLRYAVVCVFLEPRLFAGEFAESSLCRFGAALLQARAALLLATADTFDLCTGVGFSVAVGGQLDDTEINAKPVLSLKLVSLGDIAGCGQIPLPAHKAEIDLALLEGEQAALMLAHDAWDRNTTLQCPDARGSTVLHEPEDSLIIRLRGILAKDRRDLAVDLEGIGNLGDRANGHLSRQIEASADVTVSESVQIKLPKAFCVMAELSQPRRRLIAPGKRRRERKCLRLRRNQLYGGYQLHALRYGGFSMQCQERRALRAAAIPPPPEGSGFSRRSP